MNARHSIIFLALLVCFGCHSNDKSSTPKDRSPSKTAEELSKELKEDKARMRQSFNTNTPRDIANAKALLKKKASEDELIDAYLRLDLVPEDDPQYKEAQQLRRKVRDRGLALMGKKTKAQEESPQAPCIPLGPLQGRLPNGRVYGTTAEYGRNGYVTYNFHGAIRGYVVVNRSGCIVQDAREYR